MANVLALLITFGLAIYFFHDDPFVKFMMWVFGLFTVGFVLFGIFSASSKTDQNRRLQVKIDGLIDSAEAKIDKIVTQHLRTLSHRRDALVRVDRYGVPDGKAWNVEVQHFADNVIRPALTDEEADAVAITGLNNILTRLLEDRVRDHAETTERPVSVTPDMSPIDFEGLVASTMRKRGWNASTTKASGDQGADVFGEKKGLKVVVQCKLYSAVVGNKSVQEVLAAKSYYKADVAAVVCNTDFTRSAKELAQSAGVYIMHISEFEDFIGSLLD